MPAAKAVPETATCRTVAADTFRVPCVIVKAGVDGPTERARVPDVAWIAPRKTAVPPEVARAWAAVNPNVEDRPETSKVAPAATVIRGVEARDPDPVRARVPPDTTVGPE